MAKEVDVGLNATLTFVFEPGEWQGGDRGERTSNPLVGPDGTRYRFTGVPIISHRQEMADGRLHISVQHFPDMRPGAEVHDIIE